MADDTSPRLHGVVEIVNTCGNLSIMAESECRPQPASIPLTLHTPNSNAPAYSFVSDSDGRFEVTVEPGRYRLVPKTPPFLNGYPAEVDLTSGQTFEVTLRLYSEIRNTIRKSNNGKTQDSSGLCASCSARGRRGMGW